MKAHGYHHRNYKPELRMCIVATETVLLPYSENFAERVEDYKSMIKEKLGCRDVFASVESLRTEDGMYRLTLRCAASETGEGKRK